MYGICNNNCIKCHPYPDMHACTYICTRMYVHTYLHACMYIHMYMHAYACIILIHNFSRSFVHQSLDCTLLIQIESRFLFSLKMPKNTGVRKVDFKNAQRQVQCGYCYKVFVFRNVGRHCEDVHKKAKKFMDIGTRSLTFVSKTGYILFLCTN